MTIDQLLRRDMATVMWLTPFFLGRSEYTAPAGSSPAMPAIAPMSAELSLEDRVAALEAQVQELTNQISPG